MDEQEQKIFDAYVKSRQEKYSWAWFWFCTSIIAAVAVVFLYLVVRLLIDRT